MYTHTHTHTHTHIPTHIPTHINTHTHTHIHTHTHTLIHTLIHTLTHTYTLTLIHTHTHTLTDTLTLTLTLTLTATLTITFPLNSIPYAKSMIFSMLRHHPFHLITVYVPSFFLLFPPFLLFFIRSLHDLQAQLRLTLSKANKELFVSRDSNVRYLNMPYVTSMVRTLVSLASILFDFFFCSNILFNFDLMIIEFFIIIIVIVKLIILILLMMMSLTMTSLMIMILLTIMIVDY